jgi:hypothetical protein
MCNAEGNIAARHKVEMKQQAKTENVAKAKARLTNFKNEKFKAKCSDFLYWIHFVVDPPASYKNDPMPADLKASLEPVKRYECDIEKLADEVNRKFKSISLSVGLPKP